MAYQYGMHFSPLPALAVSLTVCAVSISPSHAETPQPQATATQFRFNSITPIQLKTDPRTHLLIAECRLNGVPCNLIVDTGASHTTFDMGFINKNFPGMQLRALPQASQTNVQASPYIMPVRTFSIGAAQLDNYYAMVLDLPQLRQANQINVDGILGVNYLSFTPFRLSGKNATLQFLKKDALPSLKLKPLNTTRNASGTFNVQSTLNGKPLPLLLDSGSSLSFAPPAQWPEDPKAAKQAIATADVNGASGSPVTIAKGMTATLHMGPDFAVDNLAFYLDKTSNLRQIGIDTLTRFDIVVDAQNNSVSALPADDASPSATPAAEPAAP